jgi:hypothetical protein
MGATVLFGTCPVCAMVRPLDAKDGDTSKLMVTEHFIPETSEFCAGTYQPPEEILD